MSDYELQVSEPDEGGVSRGYKLFTIIEDGYVVLETMISPEQQGEADA